jgi:hypothetical protein
MAASDPKLIAQLLDLSRSVSSLTLEVKKNTNVNSSLTEINEDIKESNDIGKVADALKNINIKDLKSEFGSLSKSLKDLDFNNIAKELKNINTKSDVLKDLDIKKISEGLNGLKKLDFKNIAKDIGKDFGKDLIKNVDLSKGIGGIKDVVSGSIGGIGKKLLGAFENGGDVKKSGNYLVGEKGPEIVDLKKGANVISNSNLSGLSKKIKDTPTASEIEEKKKNLIKEDPEYLRDPKYLADEIEYYIDSYDRKKNQKAFSKNDFANLLAPIAKKKEDEKIAGPTNKNVLKPKLEETKIENNIVTKKPNLLSKIQGTLNSDDIFNNITPNKIIGGAAKLINKNNNPLVKNGLNIATNLLSNKSSLKFNDIAKGVMNNPEINAITSKISKIGDFGIGGGIKKNLTKLSIPLASKNNQEAIQPDSGTSSNNNEQKIQVPNQIKNEPNYQEVAKTENAVSTKTAENVQSEGLSKIDADNMIRLLSEMVNLLKGPLSVSPMDSPFRPNSRKV